MPFSAIAYHKLDDDAMNERIVKLYDMSPEFADGKNALSFFKSALSKGDTLYLGIFNDKPIAAVCARGQGPTRLLQYIVVHPANRGRGLARRLVKDVCQQEMMSDVLNFEAGCGALHRILTELNYLKLD